MSKPNRLKKRTIWRSWGEKNNAFFPSNTGTTRLQLNCSVQDRDWTELSVSGGEKLRAAARAGALGFRAHSLNRPSAATLAENNTAVPRLVRKLPARRPCILLSRCTSKRVISEVDES